MEATLLAYIRAKRTGARPRKGDKQSDYQPGRDGKDKEMLKMKVDPAMYMKQINKD